MHEQLIQSECVLRQCLHSRPPTPPDDVEAPCSIAFDGLPPTRSIPRHPGYARPRAPPPLPPEQHTISFVEVDREPSVPQSNLISFYNFRGIADASKIVKIQNNIPALDLHGMKVWEAKKVTQMFLQQSRRRSCIVRIITGRGLHAPGGIPRIKPEIEDLLDNSGYTYTEINKGGCLVVNL